MAFVKTWNAHIEETQRFTARPQETLEFCHSELLVSNRSFRGVQTAASQLTAMGLGLLLRVSWICFLLFDGSTSLPAIKGYGYPYTTDSRNIGDDAEDEELISPNFDWSNWQASYNQPTGPVYTSYKQPPVTQQPGWAPSLQNLPNTPSGPEAEKLVNGVSRDWGLENLDEPILFPLPSGAAKPQPGPVQPQSPSVSSPSTGASTHYGSPTAYALSSSSSQAAKSPSFVSWQPKPVSSGYGVVDVNAGSSGAGGHVPHLVYEDIFQYPSSSVTEPSSYGTASSTAGAKGQANYAAPLEEPSFGSYPANTGAQPFHLSEMESFPSRETLNFGQTTYQPSNEISWHPQTPAISTQQVEVPQSVSEPMLPSYIVQSRSAYERGRNLYAQTMYLPEFPPPVPVNSKGVEGPAPNQPAAPKGVQNPQRVKW